MNKYKFIIIYLFAFCAHVTAQTVSVKGIIISESTSLPIANVSVMISELQLLTTSDISGKFVFNKIKEGEYFISFTHIGYQLQQQKVLIINGVQTEISILLLESELMLGEAVVTSTRSFKIIKDVPLPIELIDTKTIERSIKISTSDVIEKAPGVSLVSDGTWATGVNIRGLSNQNIVYLIDGNRIETSTSISAGLSLIDLSDVKNIEIVKGGLSSLYGTGATGGVVSIITNQGTVTDKFYFGGSLSSSYASVNSGKAASVNLHASDKVWYANFTGTLRNAEDTKIPDGILVNSGFKDNSLSLSAGILPVDNVELKLNYQKFDAEDVGIPGGEPFPINAKATYLYADRELMSGELIFKQLSSSLNNLKFKYYFQLISREVELIPNPDVVIKPQADHSTNGLALQSDWTFAKNHFLIVGIDAWERSYTGERKKTIESQSKIITDKPVPNSKFGNLGFFANDEMHLMQNRFKLNFGARYDLIKVTNEQTNNPVSIFTNGIEIIPPPNPDASYAATEVNNNSWSGNVGLLYSLFEDVSLTFNTAYSFRSPSLEERYQYIDLGSTVYYGNPNLEPEKGLFYDLGVRVWKNKFSFTADGFVNLFTDLVVDQAISDSSYQKNNVGKARLIGFDGKMEFNFLKSHSIYSSLAYVNGMDTESNEYLPQISPLNGTVGLKLSFKNYLDVNLSAIFYDEQNKISPNEEVTKGYVYFDVAFNSCPINISLFNLQVFAGIENIFDTSYRSHLSTYRGINLTEPGRNLYAKIKLAW